MKIVIINCLLFFGLVFSSVLLQNPVPSLSISAFSSANSDPDYLLGDDSDVENLSFPVKDTSTKSQKKDTQGIKKSGKVSKKSKGKEIILSSIGW